MTLRRWGVAAMIGAAVAAAAACSTSPAAAISVTPTSSLADEPLSIRITGLSPNATAQVAVATTDRDGQTWTGQAAYAASADGTLDPNTASSTGGTYSGVHAMGLVSSMQPPKDAPAKNDGWFSWPDQTPTLTWTVTVDGREVARTSGQRAFHASNQSLIELSKDKDGIVGTYAAVPDGAKHPAVLVLGGSEGGAPVGWAAALAARGIPALAQAYFKAPGLPDTLANIPLETFDAGLMWLRTRPEVDPDRIWVMGGSRGSEAALLEGSRRPDVVHGVVALSPSNVVLGSYPPGQAAWTVGNQPVPFTALFNNPAPFDVPEAVIPVEKINGPVVAVCGEADTLWKACDYSRAIKARLDAAKNGHADTVLAYPDVGHLVDVLLPYQPRRADAYQYGVSPDADADARADAWPKVVAQILGRGG